MWIKNALTKFWLVMLFCLFAAISLHAQDSTDFFPHHLGDVWEYYVIGDIENDTLQVIVTLDSTGQDGFSYIKHKRQYINPIAPAPFAWWEGFVLDTLDQVFGWEPPHPANGVIYKLDAYLGQMWIVYHDFGHYDIARVEDIYPDTLFGIPTTVKGIAYYGAQDTSDTTTWLVQYGELLADGFGTIFRGGGDLALAYQLFLKGAVIDGIVYGDTTSVGIKQPVVGIVPSQFQLFQNYPNPFNANTTIEYQISRTVPVVLQVYNIIGQKIATLLSGLQPPGKYKIRFNGSNLPSGIYYYRLEAGGFSQQKKMLMIK